MKGALTRAAFGLSLLLLALSLAPGSAQAQEGGGGSEEGPGEASGVYARVIAEITALRAGPGAGYNRVRIARRGEVFRVLSRANRGYWFQIELDDGLSAWVSGDAVYNHEVSDEEATQGRFAPDVFAPPPLPHATGELAVSFGILGYFSGFMAIRPSINIAPEFAFEATLGGSVGDGGRLYMGQLGGMINLFPRSPVVPYFVLGGGVAISDPNADTFLLQSGAVATLYGGGGIRFCFRYRITLRFEVRAYGFFDADRYVPLEEFSGGLTVFF